MPAKFRFNRNRLIRCVGQIDEELTQELLRGLGEFESESKSQAVQIVLNTPGGETDSALGAYDAIKFFTFPIITIAEGRVASSGLPIFLAGSKRYITQNSSIMIHKPEGRFNNSMTHEKLTFMALDLRRVEENFVRIIAERTGQNIVKVQEDLNKGTIFNALESLTYGLAHKII
ncbi:MAG: ATP-dependent Clp protease proteolytic subunit [Patescibacteria group bacterium]